MKKKIILAYSGGLDTSVILHWLKNKGFDVICFVANVGQKEDFEAIKNKALQTGATKVYVEDLQEEFITDYVYTALKANAVYEGSYLLGTALARPLIAKHQVALAHKEHTTLLAHGATGKGTDQIRFDLTYYTLMPNATVIAPWRDQEFFSHFKGRDDLIAYAHANKIPIDTTLENPYSIDENCMHTSFEAGILENPAVEPHESMFKKTAAIAQTPPTPATVTIAFKHGIPIEVTHHTQQGNQNTTITDTCALFSYLNAIAGTYGIGRVDMVENRFVGIKIRGVYEAPGATILWKAHKDLESLTLDRQVAHLKEYFSLTIATLIYNGLWESPEMKFLMPAIEHSQQFVTGSVTLRLDRGNVIIIGRESPHSLYHSSLASMHELGHYNQADAQGFIAITALRLKQSALQASGTITEKKL